MTPTTLKIALTIATRSEAAARDLPTGRGAQIAIDELAGRDDLPARLELLWLDDLGDERKSAELARAAVADPAVIAAVGPMGSNEAFANAPIFDEAGVLQVSPCASHPDLCRRGFRTFFRLVPDEQVQGDGLARMATSYLGSRRAAVVADSDAFGETVTQNFRRGYEARGGEIATVVRFDRGADAFDEQVEAVSASAPDLVFFAVHQHEGKAISSQLRERGLRVPFLGTDGLKTTFFLGGGDGRGESYHTHSGADFRRLASAQAFRAAYESRHPADSTYSAEAYDAVMLVAESLRRASTPDRAGVLAAFGELIRTPYAGASGEIRFSATGERLDGPICFYQVRQVDGEREMHYLGTTAELAPDDASTPTPARS